MSPANAATRRKGQPIVVLALVGIGWISARALLWNQPSYADAAPDILRPVMPVHASAASPSPYPDRGQRGPEKLEFALDNVSASGRLGPINPKAAARIVGLSILPLQAEKGKPPEARADPPLSHKLASSHAAAPAPVVVQPSPIAAGNKRWSIDSWVFWRSGSGLPSGTNTQFGGRYGATQAGLVARYDVGSGRRRPQAYVRLTHAPDRPAQSDVAAGIGFRPVPSFPIRMQAEARALHTQGRTSVAPAVLAISELPVFDLPLGFSGEAYGQAGWAGGDFATPFVDGQLRLDRAVLHAGPVELRLGGGVWGGAQKSAERLDAGPGLTLDLRDGGLPARVSVDYRFKVAGDASPGDGIAVTLSTGF